MTDRQIFVYLDMDNNPVLIGKLWTRSAKGKESASFQYDTEWLKNPERFALEPSLSLTEGTFHSGDRNMFGAIGDSAPDRWGRVLMRRAAARAAKILKQPSRTLTEMDYLLGVYDEARQGALRFSEKPGGPFLQNLSSPIPPLIELPKLLGATEKFIDDKENMHDLKLLLAPGSSLGGARPKASIIDKDGNLAIAKFPHKDDEYSNVLWEAVALKLAEKAGIVVPSWRIAHVKDKPILIITRFDRSKKRRIPFLSAMSMLNARDNEEHSYLEIADSIIQHGAYPEKDLKELWKRIVLSVLISNTDDHLRNHGFLYINKKGWSLSPIYDINPTPIEIRSRILSTSIDLHDASASLDLALSVCDYFNLSQVEAIAIIKDVVAATSTWHQVAKALDISNNEISRMSSAFEHEEFFKASKY